MKTWNPYVIAALVAGTAVFAGCTREQQTDVAQAGREVGAATSRVAGATADKAKDATITASVKSAFMAEPTLSALRIDVDTSDGRVVLRGSAPDATARGRAAQLARGVDGVVAVENQLVVEPKP
jgi:osmotically-inducible protein OsmY